jgi:choline dehydrogenase-like flavoprotein
MRIGRLTSLEPGAVLRTDLAIVGGGPVGLTIGELCAKAGLSVLVLESGLEAQDALHEELNAVELDGSESIQNLAEARRAFHASLARHWTHERQPFGVRCRGLGGSTQAWAGKSAPFDPIDYRRRHWVENSGWPIAANELEPYIRQAGELLNLCPTEPARRFAGERLVSFYWQFARSRVDHLDVMRFGREVLVRRPDGLDIMLDATITRIALEPAGQRVSHLEATDSAGRRRRVEAAHFVLAASAIENARLLLASNDVASCGIGNEYDSVGRYMMDHIGARIGSIPAEGIPRMAKAFGFYGVAHRGRSHMFMHGLALEPRWQEAEQLLNAAVYFAPQRAADDPWDSLKRLLKGRSAHRLRDFASVARGSATLASGLGVKVLASPRLPGGLRDAVVNSAIRLMPNRVAEEFESAGLPHKLCGISVEAVTEQVPCRENRIGLSDRRDRFGVPLPRARWRIGDREWRTLLRLGRATAAEIAAAGMPLPVLAEWVERSRPESAQAIDLAHTMGTTRMSEHPRTGVVDAHCRVHGIANLHVAGGSVLPTGGHANPTWMMLALGCRLAGRLQQEFD